eukprot:959364-Pyramimonas_sp.AAC.1
MADQCSYGATNELGEPVRKRTRLDATFSLRASTRHCRCRVTRGHLTGAVDGIKRTAKAAVFPKSFCDALAKDIQRISRLQTFWGCERCRLGTKTEAARTRKPGNCRMAPAAPPRPRGLPKQQKEQEVHQYPDDEPPGPAAAPADDQPQA